MSILLTLEKKVMDGEPLTREEALALADTELSLLCATADRIRRHFCGDRFDLCCIVNGKSGRCSEDCKYCAQSSRYPVDLSEYPLMGAKELEQQAHYHAERGVQRYSVVTSGRSLSDGEIHQLCESYRSIHDAGEISLCASHGLLGLDQLVELKRAGVTRYHNNLETSRRNFPNICSTHHYNDKLETIANARLAGLEVCSGGIMGLGETMEDRIDLALELRSLDVRSVPINILNPIQGTPFEGLLRLSSNEVCRVVAVFRFLLPRAALRLAGGRGLLPDKGESAFRSGANAAITGDMLTTSGISIREDLAMIHALGFQVEKL